MHKAEKKVEDLKLSKKGLVCECMADALLLIRKSVDSGKKNLCNGFGHFAAHYYLSTKFDKHYTVVK